MRWTPLPFLLVGVGGVATVAGLLCLLAVLVGPVGGDVEIPGDLAIALLVGGFAIMYAGTRWADRVAARNRATPSADP